MTDQKGADVTVEAPLTDVTVMTSAGNRVHLEEADGEWLVWLNTEDQNYSGLVIGCGGTRTAAIADAILSLDAAKAALQAA